MTKTVRIENADSSDNSIAVYTEYKDEQGNWIRLSGNANVSKLNHACQMLTAVVYIGKRLVIEETYKRGNE